MSQTEPAHDDAHHHDPPTEHNYEAANRHHFDATAHTYGDIPGSQQRADTIGGAMLRTKLFRQGTTTVMDFACGTGILNTRLEQGLVSRVLAAEDPKSIVGIDISQAMVDRYNQVVSDHGIPPEEMRAICVAPHEPDLKQALERMGGTCTFDVIVCASAYHHFTTIDRVTKSLVACLNPGGSLLVSDLVHAGTSVHAAFPDEDSHIVAHKGGFTEQDIRQTFEGAGLTNVVFDVIAHPKHAGHPVDLFLARGDRP